MGTTLFLAGVLIVGGVYGIVVARSRHRRGLSALRWGLPGAAMVGLGLFLALAVALITPTCGCVNPYQPDANATATAVYAVSVSATATAQAVPPR